jgi:adenylylsulfate kinase
MNGLVVWLTGLPSSGKSTVARRTAALLRPELPVAVLDGDEVRAALRPQPGYDDAGRDAFYETLARQGLVVLVPATAHRRAFRDRARDLAPDFLEVLVDTPLEECRRRDAKGLYARAAEGTTALPGIGVAFEPPPHPDLVVRPADLAPEAALAARVRARR